jgi:hypothetical protein
MRFKLKHLFNFLFFFIFSAALFAEDGIKIISETIDDDDEVIRGELYIGKDRMKMVSTEVDDDEVIEIIYLHNEKKFYLIDHDDEEIQEITQEDMDKLKAQLEEARKQLENLPKGMRDMMKDKMEDAMGGAKMVMVDYKKTGQTKNINGWNTEQYIGTREGEKDSEIWAAKHSEFNFKESDFQVLKDFSEFMTNALGKLADDMDLKFLDQGIDGFPVKTYIFDDDEIEMESTLKEAKRVNLTDADFQLPSDYDIEKMFD